MTHLPPKIVCNGNSTRPLLLAVASIPPFRAVEVPTRTSLCYDRRTLAGLRAFTIRPQAEPSMPAFVLALLVRGTAVRASWLATETP